MMCPRHLPQHFNGCTCARPVPTPPQSGTSFGTYAPTATTPDVASEIYDDLDGHGLLGGLEYSDVEEAVAGLSREEAEAWMSEHAREVRRDPYDFDDDDSHGPSARDR